MFTGIVQSQAEVYSFLIEQQIARLWLKASPEVISDLETGASIAINGVCLTVVEFYLKAQHAYLAFDVIQESLVVSNLANLTQGDYVNLERSLKVGDELGGHILSGHVHCQSELVKVDAKEKNTSFYFKTPVSYKKYMFDKGFIAINGISLTLGKVTDEHFSVHLIPETLTRTNLAKLGLGDMVNLEFDQQTITIVTTTERMNFADISNR